MIPRHRRLGAIILIIVGSLLLAGCPMRSPITVSARLRGLPRTGGEIELIATIRSAVPVDDARIDITVSAGLEIMGDDEFWQGDLAESARSQHQFQIRVNEPGLHRIEVYAHKSGDGSRFGDSKEIWIRSWRMFGLEIPNFIVRDRYGHFRFSAAEKAFEESR